MPSTYYRQPPPLQRVPPMNLDTLLKNPYLIIRIRENGDVGLQSAQSLRDLETLAEDDMNPANPTTHLLRYTRLP